MNPCHVITLKKNNVLLHELMEMQDVSHLSTKSMLMAPKSFCDERFCFAVYASDVILEKSFFLKDPLAILLNVSLVDDHEQKPLLQGQSSARSLFLLGELGRFFMEGLLALGMRSPKIALDPKTNKLSLDFIMPKGVQSHAMLGAFICLLVLFDALLFERGLRIASANLDFKKEVPLIFDNFKQTLKEILIHSLQ